MNNVDNAAACGELRLKTWADYADNEPEFGTARSIRRKQEIVETAFKLYEENGLTHTSVKDVADYMGASRTLFYHYFPDKAALTSAVINYRVDVRMDVIVNWDQRRRAGLLSDDEAFDLAVNRIADLIENPNSFLRAVMFYERSSLLVEFTDRFAACISRYLSQVALENSPSASPDDVARVRDWAYINTAGLMNWYVNNEGNKKRLRTILKTMFVDLVENLGLPKRIGLAS